MVLRAESRCIESQGISSQDKKQGRERAALPDSTLWLEPSSLPPTIYQNGTRRCGYWLVNLCILFYSVPLSCILIFIAKLLPLSFLKGALRVIFASTKEDTPTVQILIDPVMSFLLSEASKHRPLLGGPRVAHTLQKKGGVSQEWGKRGIWGPKRESNP